MKNKKLKIKNKKSEITEKSKIQEVIKKYPKTLEVFSKYNLPCIGCAAAHFENIGAIAKEFGINIKKLLEDLNKATK